MLGLLLRLIEWSILVLAWAFNAFEHALSYVVGLIRSVWNAGALRFMVWGPVALLTLRAFVRRRRMSHENGIAARGTVRVLEAGAFPANDVFRPGALHFCRARFSAIAYDDDARLVGRGAALKFADRRGRSPLDLLMNTGRTAPFHSVRSFWGFVWMTMLGKGRNAIRYMQIDPAHYVGSQGRLRRNPASFALLSYSTKVPVLLRLRDGTECYAKFRLQRWDRGADDGMPDAEDRLDWAWCQEGIAPGETRPPHYLKDEFRARVAADPVRFHLQMQWVPVGEHDRRELLDASLEWPEEDAPYVDVAEVELGEVLDEEESRRTWFCPTSRPACMRAPRARSIDDPASLHALLACAGWPRRARQLSQLLFGAPPRPSDTRAEGSVPHSPYAEPLELGRPEPIRIPQLESPADRAARRQELLRTREAYAMAVPGDMPTHVATLPPWEAFDRAHEARMYSNITATIADLGLAGVARVDRNPASLAAYDRYYPLRARPAVHDRWRTDEEFGAQRLHGVNPMLLERCRGVPRHFNVTQEHVAPLLPEGATLAGEVRAGRVFLMDYAILEGLPTQDNAYLAAPMCLFHAAVDGPLLPLAIQLHQTPTIRVKGQDVPTPVFTPEDPPWLWLTVKTHVQCADAAYHEVVSHLMRTHMMSETFYVCARRTLSARHPVMELLAPHYDNTLAINDAARKDMLAPHGPLPRTMAAGYVGTMALLGRAFERYRFEDMNIVRDLDRRGLCERYGRSAGAAAGHYKLTGFRYRDDGLRVYRAIERWVDDVLTPFYARSGGDEAVRGDDELRDFLAELADPAAGNVKGLPGDGRIETLPGLVEFVTQIVFTASAEHAAVNNGQYDYFGYVPNVPGAMHTPPPTGHDELTEEDLVTALPGTQNTSIQIAMVHLLSTRADWPLGHYPYGFFQGHPHVADATKRFRARLDALSVAIRSRDALARVPYPYMDPRLMGKSTLI